MSGGRVYTDVVTVGDVDLYNVISNPNGVLPARIGSWAFRSDAGNVSAWQNQDGAVLWTQFTASGVDTFVPPNGYYIDTTLGADDPTTRQFSTVTAAVAHANANQPGDIIIWLRERQTHAWDGTGSGQRSITFYSTRDWAPNLALDTILDLSGAVLVNTSGSLLSYTCDGLAVEGDVTIICVASIDTIFTCNACMVFNLQVFLDKSAIASFGWVNMVDCSGAQIGFGSQSSNTLIKVVQSVDSSSSTFIYVYRCNFGGDSTLDASGVFIGQSDLGSAGFNNITMQSCVLGYEASNAGAGTVSPFLAGGSGEFEFIDVMCYIAKRGDFRMFDSLTTPGSPCTPRGLRILVEEHLSSSTTNVFEMGDLVFDANPTMSFMNADINSLDHAQGNGIWHLPPDAPNQMTSFDPMREGGECTFRTNYDAWLGPNHSLLLIQQTSNASPILDMDDARNADASFVPRSFVPLPAAPGAALRLYRITGRVIVASRTNLTDGAAFDIDVSFSVDNVGGGSTIAFKSAAIVTTVYTVGPAYAVTITIDAPNQGFNVQVDQGADNNDNDWRADLKIERQRL